MHMDSRSAMHNLSTTTNSYTVPYTDSYTVSYTGAHTGSYTGAHTNPHARTNTQPNNWTLQAVVLHKLQTLVQKMHMGQV